MTWYIYLIIGFALGIEVGYLMAQGKLDWRKALIALLIGIAVAAGIAWWSRTSDTDGVFCTADAKLCPDGSYVGRVGPNCEFAPCP